MNELLQTPHTSVVFGISRRTFTDAYQFLHIFVVLAKHCQQSLLSNGKPPKGVAHFFDCYVGFVFLDFPIVVAQVRPYLVEQRVKFARDFRRADHLLIRRILQFRFDVQLRAELHGFSIDRNTNHNARSTLSVYLILSGIEKNRERAFTHNTSRFCSHRTISVKNRRWQRNG